MTDRDQPASAAARVGGEGALSWRVGADIGGTFTDLILVDDATGALIVAKTLTTPDDPSRGVESALREALAQAAARTEDGRADVAAAIRHLVHGTTLVTNAIIERKGAKTALLTTRGFRDAVEIGREHRYDLYDIFLEMPRPLVPRYLRLEVDERVLADGTVARPLDEEQVARLGRELAEKGIQAVAVCFLHSYRNPAHERRAAEILAAVAPELDVSISAEVVGELREYERTSTTIANVYVRRLVERYLHELEGRLRRVGVRGRLFVMLSSGGIATVETAARFPVRLLESGPAAGALAAAHYGQLAGFPDLLSFDMGGTTAKLCVIERGQPLVATEFEVDRVYRFKKGSGLPVKIPVIEMIEIGAGGGSIARVDALGLLKVGPDSAGAAPGPACYGLGGAEPTVTDADLLLGYLDPAFFLGGKMRLDRAAAERAVGKLAERLGLSLAEAAWGVHQIVNENMANAARVAAIERGKDPRAFPLFAFGGAGPVHAYRVAETLHAPAVVVPFGAGVTSTVGFLTAPLAFDFVRTFYGQLDRLDWAEVNRIFAELEAEGRAILEASGVPTEQIRYQRTADVRYVGQGHEVRVAVPAGPLDAGSAEPVRREFNRVYRELYGRSGPDVGLEVLSWRLVVAGPKPELRLLARERTGTAPEARKGERPAYFPELGGFRPTPVYDRYRLGPGAELAGPAIVEERESTVIVGPKARARVDEDLNLVLHLDQA